MQTLGIRPGLKMITNYWLEPTLLEYDWEQSVGYWVCATSHALRKTLSQELARSGITIRQWEILAWLSCNGCGSQTELAEVLGIENNTLAGVVKRMEEADLLKRESCEKDKRKNTIQPTEKAEQLWGEVAQIAHQVRAKATRNLTEADLQTFKHLCDTIHQNLTSTTLDE